MLGQSNYMLFVIYEGIIITISVVLLVLTFLKYKEKRHSLTLLLFFIMLSWSIAIVFSWLSKIIEGYLNPSALPAGSLLAAITNRILNFRVSFLFVILALYLSYDLRVKLFDKQHESPVKWFHLIFGIATMVLSIFLFIPGNILLDVIVFALVFAYMLLVYGVFMKKTLNAYKSVVDPAIQKSFLSLTIMSVLFILVFLNFLLDRILILLGDPGFTVFYYGAWMCAIGGFISAYLGYIRKPHG